MLVKGNFDNALLHGFASKNNAGIGTYGEKNIHRIIKLYLEPNSNFHEVKICSHIADIMNENGIIEVQTRAFNSLRKKLDFFLETYNVTVVYPYPAIKYLCWLDPDTGEVSPKRCSPKRYSPYDAFYELYKIKSYLRNENLHFYFLGLEIEEIRLLNGWGNDKKKGSKRLERIPKKILETLYVKNKKDYKKMIPSDISSPFTSFDFSKSAHISQRAAGYAISCLKEVGIIEKCGMDGRKYLYKII